jgi:hypothetical protein
MQFSNDLIWQNNFFRRVFVIFFSSILILGTAQSCTLFPSSLSGNNRLEYGVLKRDPVLQKEKNINPDGFAKINAVSNINGQVENQGLNKVSSTKIYRSNKKTLFLLTKEKGIFKSIDGGLVWQRLYIFGVGSSNSNQKQKNQEIGNQIKKNDNLVINDFSVDKSNDQIIYVTVLEEGLGKIYQSTNGGESFREIHTEVEERIQILFVASDPVNPERVFAVLEKGALIRSTDSGQTWQKVRTFTRDIPVQIGFVPEFEQTLFILFKQKGLAVSKDGGDTWNIQSLTKNPSLIGEKQPRDGLDFSLKEPVTFGRYEKIIPVTAGINFDYGQKKVLNRPSNYSWILVADRQMWFSENSGLNFNKLVIPSQAEQYNLYDISFDPKIGLGKIFVSIDNKLFFTNNRGETWSTRDIILVNDGKIGNISQILIDNEDTDVIYLTLMNEKALRVDGFFAL